MQIHMRLDIRGALWNRSFTGYAATVADRDLTPREAFDYLCDALAQGKKYLPLGECDNWDEEKGCLGHPD